MSSEIDQIISLVKGSRSPLIITKQDPTGDSVGSMLGLYLALEKLGKRPGAVSHGSPNIIYRFLPNFYKITSGFRSAKEFMISVDVKNTEAKNLSYTLENDKLHIFIDQEEPRLKKKDIELHSKVLDHDLVIAVNCPDLEDIGKPFEENPEFFYKTTVINIDHRVSNEKFGQINFVNVNASSTAELLVKIIEGLDPKLLDKDVATCLLTGIISDTNSFQTPNTTPQTLMTASKLVKMGADHGKIVQHLFKTRDLAQIKLWGKILSRLKSDERLKLAWATVPFEVFEQTRAFPAHVEGIVNDILNDLPNTDYILLLVEEKPQQIKGIFYSLENADSRKLAELFGGEGNEAQATFYMKNKSIEQAETEVLEQLRRTSKS